ncbi:MAG: twin-arginine translocase subunit TatC [Pirellulales bacterium]|nr:twin-arginine translocase subunit TatC [Pirellulales bacterium]
MKKSHDDDLFKDSVMTFGEHLEELRRCLWKAVLGLFIGVGIGLSVANWVVVLIQSPLEQALQDYYLGTAEDELRLVNPKATAEDVALVTQRHMIFDRVYVEPHAVFAALQRGDPEKYHGQFPAEVIEREDLLDAQGLAVVLVAAQGAAEPIWSRLDEAQQAAIRLTTTASNSSTDAIGPFVQSLNRLLDDPSLFTPEAVEKLGVGAETVEQFDRRAELNEDEVRHLNWRLMHAAFPRLIAPPHPLLQSMLFWKPVENDPRTQTQSLGAAEPFMIWLKAGFIAGLVIASPWIFYQIWTFVAAGLYPQEKKYVHVFGPFSLGLFMFGVWLAFTYVFEPVLAFFFSYNRSLHIDPGPRISEWLNFVMFLPVGFGIAFQLPLVMLFLERIHVMSVSKYLQQWRVATLIIWVLAAVLTPADPTSIFFLAVPLMVLYFGGILLCKWWPNPKK